MSVAEPRHLPASHAGRDRATAAAQIAVPVALVALALVLVVGHHLIVDHGNLTAFVCFGSHFAGATHPPAGAAGCGTQGYDGQFFFLLAHDPLIAHAGTLRRLADVGQAFRAQRLGYPLLAFLVAGGQASAIPAALVAVNVAALLGLTAWLGAALRRRGRAPLWAVAVALTPGMLLPVLRDLSDPLATACVLVGVLAWQERRRPTATVALTLAVLTREVSVVVLVALAAEVAVRAWRARATQAVARAALAQAWPVIAIPAVAFAAWQTYLTVRLGGPLGTAPGAIPLVNLVQEAIWSLRGWPAAVGGWDLVYVALVFGAMGLALRSLRARITVTSAAAGALCVVIALPMLGDFWGDTRLSAPLLSMLLLDGLQRRDRLSVGLATAASAMTLFILPFS
jgi:hypothetical protein